MQTHDRRRFAAVLAFCVFVLCGAVNAAAQQDRKWTGNLGLVVGGKWLEHGDWKPVDNQLELGIETDFRPVSWPVNLAVDLLLSFDWDTEKGRFWDVDNSGYTSEVDLGIRKYWENPGRARPFVGGGLAIARGKVVFDVPGVSESDYGVGFWANGGVDVKLGTSGYIGVEARYSKAEVTLLGVERNAGGFHLGARLGFLW